ncbi:MAG: hypothetical protein ACFB13_19650 [Kiloniellaceae bacterium]
MKESQWITVIQVMKRTGCRQIRRENWHGPNSLIKSTFVAGYYSVPVQVTTSAGCGDRQT